MSSVARRSVDLGDVEPARSRHAGRRSAVALAGTSVVVGTADGDVVAYDRDTLDERWRTEETSTAGSVVSVMPFGDGVAVGERGPAGEVRLHDAETGAVRWRYATADDVGDPQRDTRFYLPFVADVRSHDGRLFVASRRYERDGGVRSFASAVYAFDPDGSVAWRYETDASPISLDVRDERVAVAYNRCPGEHQHGLVVLDTDTGDRRFHWDPGTDGQRRVGDVSLVDDGVVLASHGDYCGYRLATNGAERWRTELATTTTVGDEALYAYPNHVHATENGVVFVTGNTYPEEGRETESLHPDANTAFGYTSTGERVWSAPVEGFASGVDAAGDVVAVPGAQNFRTRDPDAHGLRLFDVADGHRSTFETDGVVADAALDGTTVAAVEEPVVYHDEGKERGAYRLHVLSG